MIQNSWGYIRKHIQIKSQDISFMVIWQIIHVAHTMCNVYIYISKHIDMQTNITSMCSILQKKCHLGPTHRVLRKELPVSKKKWQPKNLGSHTCVQYNNSKDWSQWKSAGPNLHSSSLPWFPNLLRQILRSSSWFHASVRFFLQGHKDIIMLKGYGNSPLNSLNKVGIIFGKSLRSCSHHPTIATGFAPQIVLTLRSHGSVWDHGKTASLPTSADRCNHRGSPARPTTETPSCLRGPLFSALKILDKQVLPWEINSSENGNIFCGRTNTKKTNHLVYRYIWYVCFFRQTRRPISTTSNITTSIDTLSTLSYLGSIQNPSVILL